MPINNIDLYYPPAFLNLAARQLTCRPAQLLCMQSMKYISNNQSDSDDFALPVDSVIGFVVITVASPTKEQE